MKANVKLKEGFAKRRLAGDTEILAKVELSSQKQLKLYFLLEKEIIEVTHDGKECESKKLNEEERCAIIEAILVNYTSLIKSIFNFSISYYLEEFKLADSTAISKEYDLESILPKDTILEEYLKSKYSRNSKDAVLRELKRIYDFVNKNRLKIGKEELVISIEENLNYVQRLDLRYYLNVLFDLKNTEISTYCKQHFFILKKNVPTQEEN